MPKPTMGDTMKYHIVSEDAIRMIPMIKITAVLSTLPFLVAILGSPCWNFGLLFINAEFLILYARMEMYRGICDLR